MIFRTLYSRLAMTLFVMLFLVGILLIQLIGHSNAQYQQEVVQKLNSELAQHIVDEQELIQNQMINYAVSDPLFHDLMVINPSIELYLLDKQGVIMGYHAPAGKVKRTQVNLKPLAQFFNAEARYPLKGDDPLSLNGQKVFSAAEIKNQNGLQGYLYIVLGGEQYDDVVDMLDSSYIFDTSIRVLTLALTAALLIGLMIFALQTRRLRLLGNVMRNYSSKNRDENNTTRFPENGKANDEVDELGQQFNRMAEKISQQIDELKRTDGVRREMVANVSHDLRTPLTTMRGYLETLLLKSGKLTADEEKQYLETALSHSKHLGNLVEQLFELAKLDSCESVVYSEPFSMCELVQDVTQTFLLRAQEKNVQLDLKLNPNAPLIYGDIAMMQRVLENLLENGLRYTPVDGCISVCVDVDVANVEVRIADNGCGIPEEDVPKIFERFYQQDVNRSDNNNAGLGLAIVKRILELHGSNIRVNSKLNHGTTFSFQLAINATA